MNPLEILKEFRENPEKVKALRKALAMPIMVEATQVLDATAPENSGIYDRVSDTNNNTILGNILGYRLRANRLKDLATHIERPAIVEADYKEGN